MVVMALALSRRHEKITSSSPSSSSCYRTKPGRAERAVRERFANGDNAPRLRVGIILRRRPKTLSHGSNCFTHLLPEQPAIRGETEVCRTFLATHVHARLYDLRVHNWGKSRAYIRTLAGPWRILAQAVTAALLQAD